MQSQSRKVVILGTGGTIAGTAAHPGDNIGYAAAQIGVANLVAAVPLLAGVPLEAEQVAQVDSKDMSLAIWTALATRVAHHLARPEVAGIVVAHGTDTLEETAYFLQRLLAPAKPVVLTGAMRPSTALLSDGPQNLLDAVTVAREVGARGVVAVLSGAVHSAMDVRKAHSYRVDAFTSGEAGMLGVVEEGRVRCFRGWPATVAAGLRTLPAQPDAWPVVEIITSHAGAGGRLMQAALAAGVHGIVVAGSGNGGVNVALEVELRRAQEAGVLVWRSSRCLQGPVQAKPGDVFPDAGNLTPVKARIEMMLQLLETRRDASS